jgi:hypothetical protein
VSHAVVKQKVFPSVAGVPICHLGITPLTNPGRCPENWRTHPLTHSPTHPLIHSRTYSPPHPLTHLLTHPRTHSLTHSLTRS